MTYISFKNTLLFVVCASFFTCEAQTTMPQKKKTRELTSAELVLGIEQIPSILHMTNSKKIGIVGNQTSILPLKNKNIHLVDTLLSHNVKVIRVFAPEHGFRGKADAGEQVKDDIDIQTRIPIVSLYGKQKKPTKEHLQDIDLLIFDIQDVGTRFYTYISTLHYVMEACAENNIPLLVLDRPNPNGHYIDGPILEKEHESFVGMHPIPIVHGMSIGEYAMMINGEQWLVNAQQTNLFVIEMKNYQMGLPYKLPVSPSPNLPTPHSIAWYPTTCFFEGTNVNEGRGTEAPFELFGSPYLDKKTYEFSYVPHPNEGSKYPKHEGKKCFGADLRTVEAPHFLELSYLIEAYQNTSNQEEFFIPFFEKLAGTSQLRQQIEAGLNANEIRANWEIGINKYREMATKYYLYDRVEVK